MTESAPYTQTLDEIRSEIVEHGAWRGTLDEFDRALTASQSLVPIPLLEQAMYRLESHDLPKLARKGKSGLVADIRTVLDAVRYLAVVKNLRGGN